MNNNKSIVIIDTDKNLQKYLEDKLSEDGYTVISVLNELETFDVLKKITPCFIIMELDFPSISGKSLLVDIKNKYSDTPLLVLTKSNSTSNIVRAFKSGADDYMSKPFAYNELLVRIQARLDECEEQPSIKVEDIEIETQRKRVNKSGKHILLSPKEYSLLLFLAKNKGIVYSREELLEKVWGLQRFVVPRSIDVYMGRLRKKLDDPNGKFLKTRRGFGYFIKP